MVTNSLESFITAMATTVGVITILWITATTDAEAWQGILSASVFGLLCISISSTILKSEGVSK